MRLGQPYSTNEQGCNRAIRAISCDKCLKNNRNVELLTRRVFEERIHKARERPEILILECLMNYSGLKHPQ